MHELGPLRRKYIIEHNELLQEQTMEMCKKDLVAQWLMGNELKQDQFNFLYESSKIIYDSALQDKILAQDPVVVESIIPKLTAFRAVLVLRNIQLQKYKELKKEREKIEREGGKVQILSANEALKAAQTAPSSPSKKEPARAPSKSPVKKDKKGGKAAKKGEEAPKLTQEEIIHKQLNPDPYEGLSEDQIERMRQDDERKKYGRYWIWEGYFPEKQEQLWLDTADALKHVNDHVLLDIEDFILLEGFKKEKPDKIKKIIEDHHSNKIQSTKKLMPKDGDAFEEKAKNDMKKRQFLNKMRPPQYWNFFESKEGGQKVEHVLRYNANPHECYSDGRIKIILDNLEQLGMTMTMYEPDPWKRILNSTLDIFKNEYKEYQKKLQSV